MDFISGSYFKKHCKYRIGEYTSPHGHKFIFEVDDNLDNDYVFCKTEYLAQFIHSLRVGEIKLPDRFVLFTHNSDLNITDREGFAVPFILERLPQLRHWYAQNVNTEHPMLSPIPIGIANPKWEHGNTNRFRKQIAANIFKSTKELMLYANFNVATNPTERNYCLSQTGMKIETQYPAQYCASSYKDFTKSTQETYLRDMAASYFILSPNGVGIDCHKTWEAIYMKAVPIVTRSVMADFFKEKVGIPLLIINDWSEFSSLKLTPELYYKILNHFDIETLNWDLFIKYL